MCKWFSKNTNNIRILKYILTDLFDCICHISISPVGFSYVITHFSSSTMDIILSKYTNASNHLIIKCYRKCECTVFVRR